MWGILYVSYGPRSNRFAGHTIVLHLRDGAKNDEEAIVFSCRMALKPDLAGNGKNPIYQ